MKYFKFITSTIVLFLLIITLDGCSRNSLTENTYISREDYQYMYFTQGSKPQMVEAEDGYYFYAGFYLYYADKKEMKPTVVCNKPNCLHNKETDPSKVNTCNAFVYGPGSSQFLAYYNGDLYTTSTVFGKEKEEYELIKISADGTKRKSVFKFDVPPESLAIHRGKVYYTQSAFDKNQKSMYEIKEFDLKGTFAKPKEIYAGKLEGGTIQDLICYGNNMYFTEFAHNDKVFTTRVMRHDILSKKTDRLFENDDDAGVGVPVIFDNELYYYICSVNRDGSVKEKRNFVSDLNGKHAKESFNFDYISNVLADRHYLYNVDVAWAKNARSKEDQSVAIVNKEGEILDNIKTSSIKGNYYVICGGDNHIFVKTFDDDIYKIFYADKKQFGDGNIELKPFFEIERKYMTPAIFIKH